jgi:hypothetical protein
VRLLVTGPPSPLLQPAADAIGRQFGVPSLPPESVLAVHRLNDRMLGLAGCTRLAAVPDVPGRLPADVRQDLARRARRVAEVRLGRTWCVADPSWSLTSWLWADALEPDVVVIGWQSGNRVADGLVALGATTLEVAAGIYSLYLAEAMRGFEGVRKQHIDLSRLSPDADTLDPSGLEAMPEHAAPTPEMVASLERQRRATVLDALTRRVEESELDQRRRALDATESRLREHEAEVLRAVRDPVEQLRRRLAEVMLDRSRLVQEENDRRQERNRLFLEKRALQEEYETLRAQLDESR